MDTVFFQINGFPVNNASSSHKGIGRNMFSVFHVHFSDLSGVASRKIQGRGKRHRLASIILSGMVNERMERVSVGR